MDTGAPLPTVVTHLSGERFSIRIRGHEIIVDQTIAGGGEDSAPTPLDLLGASLGSCIAFYMRRFLETRALPSNALRVEVSHTRGRNPSRIDAFQVSVTLPPDIPAKYRPMIERVLETCPAHATLGMGANIEVEFFEPAVAV